MFQNSMKSIRETAALANFHLNQRKICTSAVWRNKDKYSLKNIGSGKTSSSGAGRSKEPSYKKFGGSKEFPVTLYQLPYSKNDVFKEPRESRHKLMIENALQNALETLISSEKIDLQLAGCPIEITRVELTSNFSCATVFWSLDVEKDGFTEDDVERLLQLNLEHIRSMLPAFHSMTFTPCVSFSRSKESLQEKLIEQAFEKLMNKG